MRPSHAEESVPPGRRPEDVAEILARRKAGAARAAGGAGDDSAVLAADTLVVAADGRILGKPASSGEAEAMLRLLSGTTHRVITGVSLLVAGGRERTGHDVTLVTMRALSAAEVTGYAASGESFGKAGGYAIQETGDRFVTEVRGSWSNVVGLPLELVLPWLRDEGLA